MRTLEYPEFHLTIQSGPGRDTTQDSVSVTLSDGTQCQIENSLKHQPSILTATTTLGIKASGKVDFTVMKAAQPSTAAGVFTRNRCPSMTVVRNRRCLESGKTQAIAVNSGNANVFTPRGAEDAEEIATLLAQDLQIPADQILVCSTGVIGVPLPMDKFRAGIPGVSAKLRAQNLDEAAHAILTTDLGPKPASVKHNEAVICGIAKGAGMIEPNLATMLVYLYTNVDLPSNVLKQALRDATADSFNSLSVDTDTSTSDSVILVSTGEVPATNISNEDFTRLLRALCIKLSRDIVSQGEGVTKIIEAHVECDVSMHYARQLTKQIINSPLFKCAVHGGDPNWGRIVMAIGKVQGPAEMGLINPGSLEITLQDLPIYRGGATVEFDKETLRQRMVDERVVRVFVRTGTPVHRARAWGCDLSADYVRINADYTT